MICCHIRLLLAGVVIRCLVRRAPGRLLCLVDHNVLQGRAPPCLKIGANDGMWGANGRNDSRNSLFTQKSSFRGFVKLQQQQITDCFGNAIWVA